MSEELDFENAMVLETVQALLGSIEPTMSAISIATRSETRKLDIYVATSGAVHEDFVDDLVVDLDASTGVTVDVDVHIWTGSDWTSSWPGRDRRLIYAARA